MSAPASDGSGYVFERSPWNRAWLWTLLSAAMLTADFFTGTYILFPILFVLPVMLVAWHRRLQAALALTAFLAFMRLAFQFHWGLPTGLAPALINTAIRLAVLALLAALTSRVAVQTRELRRRVSLLEGILPICGFCKDIRDESGEWNKLEEYISHHSEAQFSHGVCQKCAQEHYGAAFEKSRAARTTRAVFRP